MKKPSLKEWKKLYGAANRVKKLEPWNWLSENQFFGVKNPETGGIGFVSVMGALGEHYSIAVYMGSEGLYGLLDLYDSDPLQNPEILLEIPQLQASFESRQELEKEDINIIKKLGYKFKGKSNWPMFRSYRPGHVPWFLDADEARFLTYALEQLEVMAPRLKEDPEMLDFENYDEFLIRIPEKKDGEIIWNETVESVPPPEDKEVSFSVDQDIIDDMRKKPKKKANIQMGFFMIPSPIMEGERPFFPYMLVIVDGEQGTILGQEIFQPKPSPEDMWTKVPNAALEQLAVLKTVPKEIKVTTDLLEGLLYFLTEELDIKIKFDPRLPAIAAVKKHLMEFLGMGGVEDM